MCPKPSSLRFGLALLLLLAGHGPLAAFSPYESYLASGEATQVGLIAALRPESGAEIPTLFETLDEAYVVRALAREGIRGLSIFSREIDGSPHLVARFLYDGDRSYLGAAEAFERATGSLDWETHLEPHPRALRYGRIWLQMEWINHIRGDRTPGPPKDRVLLACEIIPEKEAHYRTLHQTVWPGVVDQAIRGRIRDLGIFLVELDERLIEFLYLEYMGRDAEGDDAANKADPVNQRWWRQTDACQRPLPGVTGGIWSPLLQRYPAQPPEVP